VKSLREKQDNECIAKTSDYWVWKKSKPTDKEAYFIKKNTIICFTKERFIEVFNNVQASGGNFYPTKIRKAGGCDCFQGWSIGRIIKTVPNSNVVKIQYEQPFTGRRVREGWVHISTIETVESYKSKLAR
jgi:hypothetical protein